MYIFVDESGSFVHAPNQDSWSVVVAFALPEAQVPRMEALVHAIRKEHGGVSEVKLKSLGEARYVRFLKDLSKIGGLVFATAVDLKSETPTTVAHHRDRQAAKIVEHKDRMLHPSAREGLIQLGDSLRNLPGQLYIQLIAQIELFFRTVERSSLYYSQHKPEALKFFRWRLDQKNSDPTAYDRAFKMMLPAIIQTKSMQQPFVQFTEGDYSYFDRFEFAAGEAPTYLSDDYGLPPHDGFDVGKIMREDFQLVDSATEPGVQVADLLASGLRRLLRGEFGRSHEVALLLGANFLSTMKSENIVHMISLTGLSNASERTEKILSTLRRTAKPILA